MNENINFRIITGREELDNVKFIRTRPLKVSFPEISKKEIVLYKLEDVEVRYIYSAFSYRNIDGKDDLTFIGEFYTLEAARKNIISLLDPQVISPKILEEITDEEYEEITEEMSEKDYEELSLLMNAKNRKIEQRKTNRKIFAIRVALVLIVLGACVWAYIALK